jgi:hypothetical protein
LANKLYDLARMTTATTGTGTITLGAAVSGYLSFTNAGISNGDVIDYAISDGSNSEIGTGTFTLSGTTLSRTPTKSTNSNLAISLSGTAQVFISPRAETLSDASGLTQGLLLGARIAQLMRSYLTGLNLSTAGSSTTFGVSSGVATDSTNVDVISLSSAFTKTTSAFVSGSGNGALDTGTITASVWYWVFLIKNTTTGAVDICITEAVAATTPIPTLPSGFTIYRYIGSLLTNASSQWTSFNHVEDTFYWVTSVLDVNNTSPTNNTDVTQTISVPLGIRVKPMLRVAAQSTVNASDIVVRSPDLMSAESTPAVDGGSTSASVDAGATMVGVTGTRIGANAKDVHTNTSGQIVYRANFPSGSGSAVQIRTYGWVDSRGRFN